ncbi:MAG: PEP-CTERM sorting domain-containing protein [Akkermansiaceae bacterium]|nr:PEP-CTERM sorting domain-containing protein [Akkermansiaceae bacterium]
MKPLLFCCVFCAPFSMAGAAVLTGSVTSSGLGANIDLSARGTLGWAAWNYTSTTTATGGGTIDASSRKSGGPTVGNAGYISAIGVGGTATSIRGVGGTTTTFSFTGGTGAATTFGPATMGGVIAGDLNAVGHGVSLSILGDPSLTYRVSVWVTGQGATGTMTATLPGATTPSLTMVHGNDSRNLGLFTYDFRPDTAGQALNLTYTLTTDNTYLSSHVGIQAVSVEVIPEPSSAIALVGGLALLGLRRRR